MQSEIRIEIPKHIRQVQLSQKQRPIYYEWNGLSIFCKKKKIKIPRKLYKDSSSIVEGQNILIEHLKDNFCIAVINKTNKIVDKIKVNNLLPPLKDLVYGYKYILHVEQESRYFPVYANPMKVNTPKMYLINGQDIYNGYLTGVILGFVMGNIKENFKPHIQDLPIIDEYPIDIRCEVHDTIKNPYAKNNSKLGGHWDIDNYVYPYLKAFPDLLVAEKKIRDDDRLHIPGNIPAIFVPVEDHENRKLVFIISKTIRKEIVENESYKEYHNERKTETDI